MMGGERLTPLPLLLVLARRSIARARRHRSRVRAAGHPFAQYLIVGLVVLALLKVFVLRMILLSGLILCLRLV